MTKSRRSIQASRANGARSRGPKTLEGKQRSSYNAVRHGLLSNCIVLKSEKSETFEKLVEQFVEHFAPVNDLEFGMIEELAACHWRMRRGWAIETEMLNAAFDRQTGETPIANLAAAFTDAASAPQLSLLHRYESRLHRMYYRALRTLLELRDRKLAEAAVPAVESKEEIAAEPVKTSNCETNLIPITDTRPDPLLDPFFDGLTLQTRDFPNPIPISERR